jgi:steroid 5-alpha reductase family enzyme
MENLLTIFGSNLAAVISMMICGWLISLINKNVSIVDSLWGLGFVLIAWITFGHAEGFTGRKFLIVLLTTIWGLRLSAHLFRRNWGKGEDPRYGSWRKASGNRFWIISLFKVFLLQALFLWVIALAIQYGQVSPTPAHFTWLDVMGFVIWMIGFVFESVSDWQLARFKADPDNRGKVMDRGLWTYSRHPNYFGDFLIWWGIFLITLSTPKSGWTVVSPLVISAVLLKMTGIPLTEKTIVKTRPGYRAYIKRTPAFFPWFPKRRKHERLD